MVPWWVFFPLSFLTRVCLAAQTVGCVKIYLFIISPYCGCVIYTYTHIYIHMHTHTCTGTGLLSVHEGYPILLGIPMRGKTDLAYSALRV